MKPMKAFGRRPLMISEKIEGKSIVDKAGYIPFNEQIRNMRAAGNRLEEYRRAMYTNEIEEEMQEDFRVNPMGAKDFDEFMAYDLSRSLTVKKILAEKAAKAVEEEKRLEELKREQEAVKSQNKSPAESQGAGDT